MSETINIRGHFTTTERSTAAVQSELSILIRDCIAESRTAQKRLFDQYAPAAYGVIRRYLYNNEPLAQEVLNDSFFKILTKLEQYNFQGPFEGWIRRIVINTITDNLRKTINVEQHYKEIQPEDAFVNCESVEKMSHKELLGVIHTLPDTQRTVFNLFVFESYSHKEIGSILNINENNSRWHLNDARKRLKEKLNFIMK